MAFEQERGIDDDGFDRGSIFNRRNHIRPASGDQGENETFQALFLHWVGEHYFCYSLPVRLAARVYHFRPPPLPQRVPHVRPPQDLVIQLVIVDHEAAELLELRRHPGLSGSDPTTQSNNRLFGSHVHRFHQAGPNSETGAG